MNKNIEEKIYRMVRLMELLGTLGLTVKDVGEITGFMLAVIAIGVFMGNIAYLIIDKLFDLLDNLIDFLLDQIKKHREMSVTEQRQE